MTLLRTHIPVSGTVKFSRKAEARGCCAWLLPVVCTLCGGHDRVINPYEVGNMLVGVFDTTFPPCVAREVVGGTAC